MAYASILSRRAAAGLAAAGMTLGLATGPGAANEARVDATYNATLSGWSVASGNLSFALDGAGSYRASIGAQVNGFASLVANRSAQASAVGRAQPGNTLSRSYALSINGGPAPNEVAMTFSGGSVASVSATELRNSSADGRIPVTPQHKRNVIDPLGAFVVTVDHPRDAVTPKVCNRTLRVFDGRVRYDLRLVYGATTEVQGEPGSYSGPAIVCAVNYRPIAGFRPLSTAQDRFERNIEFSIWFVPVGNTRVLIPYKVVVGTPMGLLVVAASRFEVKGSRTAAAGGETATPAVEAPAIPLRD